MSRQTSCCQGPLRPGGCMDPRWVLAQTKNHTLGLRVLQGNGSCTLAKTGA
jgi:hypothetical protein